MRRITKIKREERTGKFGDFISRKIWFAGSLSYAPGLSYFIEETHTAEGEVAEWLSVGNDSNVPTSKRIDITPGIIYDCIGSHVEVKQMKNPNKEGVQFYFKSAYKKSYTEKKESDKEPSISFSNPRTIESPGNPVGISDDIPF